MNYRLIGRTTGQILLLEALFMLPALLFCLVDQDWKVAVCFLLTIAIQAGFAALVLKISHGRQRVLRAQDGFVTVAVVWMLLSAFGALPFFLSGQIPSYVDALFETVSGFTTTGASILSDVEALSRGLLYWRSFTHWLGGMGILVFTLAVVPADRGSGGTLYLLRAESPGPDVGKFTPRLRQTALILYGIYVALTAICFLFLLVGGMPFFDSLCTAFGTAGTGGFGIRNDSIAGYAPHLQTICTVFMLLFGVNFNLYYLLLLRQVGAVFQDEELRCYLLYFFGATALISWNIRPMMSSWGDSIHHAAFQVSSIMTTTGFSTADFDLWPPLSKAVLLTLMVLGACAGSTGGGIKTIRLVLLFKGLRSNIRQLLRPRNVELIHVNGQVVDERVMRGVNSYMAAYWLLLFSSIILISVDEFSVESNISAVMACFNNIGPGFDAVGPTSNFSVFSNFSKLVLSLDMLLGRLEIFPLLALFSSHSWSRRL